MTKHKPRPWAAHQAIGPDHVWNSGNYKINDHTCPYCGLDMSNETEVSAIMDSKTHTCRLAHPKCIDNDAEWQKIERDWVELQTK